MTTVVITGLKEIQSQLNRMLFLRGFRKGGIEIIDAIAEDVKEENTPLLCSGDCLTAQDTCGICGYTGKDFEVCPECGANYVENAK